MASEDDRIEMFSAICAEEGCSAQYVYSKRDGEVVMEKLWEDGKEVLR